MSLKKKKRKKGREDRLRGGGGKKEEEECSGASVQYWPLQLLNGHSDEAVHCLCLGVRTTTLKVA